MRWLAALLCLAVVVVAGLGAASGRAQLPDPAPTGTTGPTAPVPTVTSTVVPAATAKPKPRPAKPKKPKVTFGVTAGQSTTSVLARGLRVRLRCNVVCAVRARLYKGSTRFGEGVATLRGRHGTAVVVLAARRRATVERRSGIHLQLRVQATSAEAVDGPVLRRSLTLKRR